MRATQIKQRRPYRLGDAVARCSLWGPGLQLKSSNHHRHHPFQTTGKFQSLSNGTFDYIKRSKSGMTSLTTTYALHAIFQLSPEEYLSPDQLFVLLTNALRAGQHMSATLFVLGSRTELDPMPSFRQSHVSQIERI